jgi:L-proline---[L-prolyl-carrier protein] ligase
MSWRLSETSLGAFGEAVALQGDACSGRISYRLFAGRVRAVADQLRMLGLAAGERVAVLSSGRGADEPTALAGILAAGCVAVPLDAAAPVARWRQLVEAADCRAVVHDEAARGALTPGFDGPRIELDEAGYVMATTGQLDGQSSHAGDADTALVLHTSGSTGEPKPIAIRWQAIDAFTGWMGGVMGLMPGRRVLRVAELGFDLALFDHLASWRFGATLLLTKRRNLRAAKSLTATLRSLEPHVIYAVPALFMMLTQASGSAPRTIDRIAFAGERYPIAQLRALAQWASGARLFNLYGPTETNVCCFHEVTPGDLDRDQTAPIGRACPYAELKLVDDDGRAIEGPGIGELVVRGPTAVTDHVHTRDRIERDADGLLHFRERIDRMVKIAGRRVEPAEVEAVLSVAEGVAEAAVIAAEDPRLGRYLVAFVTGQRGLDTKALRRHVGSRLPRYMVPDRIRQLDELPRTSNGKVDHAALPT